MPENILDKLKRLGTNQGAKIMGCKSNNSLPAAVGFYQSELKCYFRDQEYFRNYLIMYDDRTFRFVAGNYSWEDVINVDAVPSKFGMYHESGDAFCFDFESGFNKYSFKCCGENFLLALISGNDYSERSGVYFKIDR